MYLVTVKGVISFIKELIMSVFDALKSTELALPWSDGKTVSLAQIAICVIMFNLFIFVLARMMGSSSMTNGTKGLNVIKNDVSNAYTTYKRNKGAKNE